MKIRDEIIDLIGRGYEGEYWDYKQCWYDNNVSLVHDIICFANNIVNHDSYIIIGVNDDAKIVGVNDDKNIKTSANINDLLSRISMGGDYRPTVRVVPLNINDYRVDVIIIENTNKTPFYLTEDFEDKKDKKRKNKILRANHIYTRINDKNTSIDSSADFDKQEYLWKKRFGIDQKIYERLMTWVFRY